MEWHTKKGIAHIGVVEDMAVQPAGTGAENSRGERVRKMIAANIGELAKCVTE